MSNNNYICLNCFRTFNEPQRIVERHGFDRPPYEEFTACPFCGGDYTKAVYCDNCKQPITGDFITVKDLGVSYCSDCITVLTIEDSWEV